MQRDPDHFVGHRHFKIHARLQRLAHGKHIPVLDVAPVLAQVQCNAVGAGLLGDQRRIQRVGIAGATRLAQRGHVIDVHAQRDARMKYRLAHEPS